MTSVKMNNGREEDMNFSMSIDIPAEHMRQIFGMQDNYIKKLERDFEVTVVDRNGQVVVSGGEMQVKRAVSVLRQLDILSDRGNEIEEQKVDYAIAMGKEAKEEALCEIDSDQTQDIRAEKLRGCDTEEYDRVWHGPRGNRQNLSGNGYGDHCIQE